MASMLYARQIEYLPTLLFSVGTVPPLALPPYLPTF